jgi:hypothetical protein
LVLFVLLGRLDLTDAITERGSQMSFVPEIDPIEINPVCWAVDFTELHGGIYADP